MRTEIGYLLTTAVRNSNKLCFTCIYSLTDDLHKADMELNYNFEAVLSLQFPLTTTAQLFEKVNKYQLKVQVQGLTSFQTNCSNRNWEKIVRVQATDSNLAYHLALRHTVGKDGRTVVISSPLQVQIVLICF